MHIWIARNPQNDSRSTAEHQIHVSLPSPVISWLFFTANQLMRSTEWCQKVNNRELNVVLKMLHVAPKMCWKRRPFLIHSNPFPRVLNIYGGWGQILGGVVRRDSKVFVGLYAKNDVLVGTAPRLLAQEQTGGQARWLARYGHVVRSPRLTVFVHHSETPAGGAVPDALLGPDRWMTGNINKTTKGKKTKEYRESIRFTDQKGSAKTSRPSKE